MIFHSATMIEDKACHRWLEYINDISVVAYDAFHVHANCVINFITAVELYLHETGVSVHYVDDKYCTCVGSRQTMGKLEIRATDAYFPRRRADCESR